MDFLKKVLIFFFLVLQYCHNIKFYKFLKIFVKNQKFVDNQVVQMVYYYQLEFLTEPDSGSVPKLAKP